MAHCDHLPLRCYQRTGEQAARGLGPLGTAACPHPARAGFGAEPTEPMQRPNITHFKRAAYIYIPLTNTKIECPKYNSDSLQTNDL